MTENMQADGVQSRHVWYCLNTLCLKALLSAHTDSNQN